MIALVRIALRRPYTFVVLALVILIVGPLAAMRTPVDIFPDIRIPVIAIIWQYTGLPPEQMAGRITTQSQRALTTTVNDIEHIEATSYNGLGIIKVFFQPGADIRIANAQVTAVSQTLLKHMPPNTTPPLILNYNASTVPIIQLGVVGLRLVRAGAGRYRTQHTAHAARHRSGRRYSAALRRQVAAGADRSRRNARCRRAACPGRMSPTRSPRKI